MSAPKDGGPAFPTRDIPAIGMGATEGMTLRDYFAAKALGGMLADTNCNPEHEDAARAAYRYADAMLAEREVR